MARALRPDYPGSDDPGAGVRLALDVGTARIGVARSDAACTLAVPVQTVARRTGRRGPDGADIDTLVALVAEYDAVELIIGLPMTLSGEPGASAKDAGEIAFRLGRRIPGLPIRFADERFSTVAATRALHAAGKAAATHRPVIDQAAAVDILEGWLHARRVALEL